MNENKNKSVGGGHKHKNQIVVRGAREHNLNNVDVTIPRDSFVVFTGVSGSGKSTLAFDTIFAEGQRRYLESLSSYARQFLGQMDKPDVDSIDGLSPAISIDQKTASHNPRSTVGTVTEIYDYLRLLYAKIGVPHCTTCDRVIAPLTTDEIVERIMSDFGNAQIDIVAPVVRARKGTYLKTLQEYWDRGFARAYVNDELVRLDEVSGVKLARYKKHDISIVVDRVTVSADEMSRIFEAVEIALRLTEGLVVVRKADADKKEVKGVEKVKKVKKAKNIKEKEIAQTALYNAQLACPDHENDFGEIAPRLFSFNSPEGACSECEGLGVRHILDTALIAPDHTQTIGQGALLPWSARGNTYMNGVVRAICNHYNIPDNVRLRDLSKKHRQILFDGDEEPEEIAVKLRSQKGSVWKFNVLWKGLLVFLDARYRKTESSSVRRDIEQYMTHTTCSACGGSRLRSEARAMQVANTTLPMLLKLSITEIRQFFDAIKLSPREQLIGQRIVAEVAMRLSFLDDVGLGYLTLGRAAHTLSGGESQRIRLASQIGAHLVGVLYILDEPSIGLHPRDNAKLLETLLQLRDNGNSVIVIEHDEETIRAADFVVDVGPRAGKHGGDIVVAGTVDDLLQSKQSLTAQYLRSEKEIAIPSVRRTARGKKSLVVRGACEHNLRNVTAEFPLGTLTCVTGVSGSGKSTLVEDILYKSLSHTLNKATTRPGKHAEILGTEYVDKIIMVDQSPIGRTPRSNPATYTGVFTPIRQLFAYTRDARTRGYEPGRFSFNVVGGRCDNCKGDGTLKIQMQFMADVYLPCDVCGGARYNSETLQVRLNNKTISEVLAMTVYEAVEFFAEYASITDVLQTLVDVGLGYIHLGQSATTLSGGEAQRVKLATELARRATGKTVYILDEPTTGLHFDDVAQLVSVLHRLVDAGNTVIVIEHNIDIIKVSDWIIDLGPDGGDGGGRIVVTGTPEEVAKHTDRSATASYIATALRK